MQEIGYHLLNTITRLAERLAEPRLPLFTHSTEILLWASPMKTRPLGHRFNYKAMKEENGGKQMRDLWQIPLARGRPGRVVGPDARPAREGPRSYPTQGSRSDLLERVLASSATRGDLVLDPFSGSGTGGSQRFSRAAGSSASSATPRTSIWRPGECALPCSTRNEVDFAPPPGGLEPGVAFGGYIHARDTFPRQRPSLHCWASSRSFSRRSSILGEGGDLRSQARGVHRAASGRLSRSSSRSGGSGSGRRSRLLPAAPDLTWYTDRIDVRGGGLGGAHRHGHFSLGGWVFLFARASTSSTGASRAPPAGGRAGAFLDSTLDRVGELFFFSGRRLP